MWYCNEACQKAGWRTHKSVCNVPPSALPGGVVASSGAGTLALSAEARAAAAFAAALAVRRGVRLVGFRNHGNSCYLSSTVQCLARTWPLLRLFVTGDFARDLNKSNPLGSGGKFAQAWATMCSSLWQWGGPGAGFLPAPQMRHDRDLTAIEFHRALAQRSSVYMGYQQHDAQELVGLILDTLHEDLNRVLKKPYVEAKDSDGRPDDVVAAEAWAGFEARNVSELSRTFFGQAKSSIQCPVCDKLSVTFDPFSVLTLHLPNAECSLMAVDFLPLITAAPGFHSGHTGELPGATPHADSWFTSAQGGGSKASIHVPSRVKLFIDSRGNADTLFSMLSARLTLPVDNIHLVVLDADGDMRLSSGFCEFT